jgi:DNA invertase Pin-like site-specific DNA recombinase
MSARPLAPKPARRPPPPVRTSAPWAEGSAPGKVPSWRQERLAVVYVRQSTPQQVLEHQESTRLQDGLTARAGELGWPAGRVLVIDDDLGKSGTSTAGRTGFQRLVSEVSLDHVGLILGVEMSRLARACADWYQLLELCALFGTLLADLDGIYAPSQYNDRLLLGLKGTMSETMSEVELHLMQQRMRQGLLAKARRGALRLPLPMGYVERASGEIALDPDEQVQAVLRLIFRTDLSQVCRVGHRPRPLALPGCAPHPSRDAPGARPWTGRGYLAPAQPRLLAACAQAPHLCGCLRLRAPAS